MVKTDVARYTIRFNQADPYHLKVMGILNYAGRRKASLIADAICAYCGISHDDMKTEHQQLSSLPIMQPTSLPSVQISSDWVSIIAEGEGGETTC